MGIILAIIIGGIVGWIASKVMKTDAQMGILANIIVGVIGSSLGSWIAGLIGLGVYGLVARLLVGVAGACLLIVILKGLKILK